MGQLSQQLDSEIVAKAATACRRDRHCAAVALTLDPAGLEAARTDSSTERAGKVRTTLAPIEAGPRETAPLMRDRLHIDAEAIEEIMATPAHLEVARIGMKMPLRQQPVHDGDSELAGQMVITGPCHPQPFATART